MIVQEMLASSRIAADENINDYAGKTEEEINELIASKVTNKYFGIILQRTSNANI